MPFPSSSDDPSHAVSAAASSSTTPTAPNHVNDSHGGNNSALNVTDGDSQDSTSRMKALDTAARPLMFPSPAHESSPASPPSSPPTSPSASSSSSSSPPFSLPAIRDRLRPFFLSPSNSEHLPVTRDDPHPYHPSHPPNHALALPRLRITPTLFSNTLLLLLSLLILLPLLAIPLLAPPSPLPPPTAAAQPAAEGSLGQEVGGEEDYGASGGGGIEVTDSDGSGGGGRDGSERGDEGVMAAGDGSDYANHYPCSEPRSLEEALTDLATSAGMPPPETSKQPAPDVAPQGLRAAEAAADAKRVSKNSSTGSTTGSTAGSSNAGNDERVDEKDETEDSRVVAEEGESGRGLVIVTVLSEAWIPMMKMFLTRIRLVDDRDEETNMQQMQQQEQKLREQQQQQQQQQEEYLRGAAAESAPSDSDIPGTGRMPRMPRTLVSRLLVICYDHRSLEFCSSLRLHCFLDTQVRVAKVWGMGHEALRGTLVPRLLAICYDHRSLEFCCSLRLHCFLDTQEDAPKSERDDFSGGQKKFMTPSYLHLMWRRLHIIRQILSLRFDVIFTDNDVIWLQNPLPHLLNVPSDLLIACDRWSADPKAAAANGGFYMAHSNDRVLRFFDYWLESHTRLPGIHDQDAFMRVRPEADPYTRVTLRLSVHYLPTESFSGFCEIGRQLGRLVTVHANCCLGLEKKMQVLQQVLGEVDWFRQLPLVDRVGVGRHGLSWSGRNCIV